mgnify:CR=1 FL=1
MDKDTELFKGKTFSDIMSDVYNNSKKKDKKNKSKDKKAIVKRFEYLLKAFYYNSKLGNVKTRKP